MRITGGIARGIPLDCPPGKNVRPATDRMREAVFSSLGDCVQDARFLDVFAGTGSYGLEALSRGAAAGTFVEKDPRAHALLLKNLAAVSRSMGGIPADAATCVRTDAIKFRLLRPVDLIFADPPYEWSRSHLALLLDKAAEWLRPDSSARLILELPADVTTFGPWECLRILGGKGRDAPSVRILRRAS